MENILLKIKKDVDRHADIMSKIMKVDVEIVDSQMNLISGKFNRYAYTKEDGTAFIGCVYQEVISTGEKQIIMNPGSHPLCKKCVQKDVCEEKFEMSAPIKLKDQVIGVIGFVCYTDEQLDYIQSNLEVFMEFLDQMTGLIALKAAEMKESIHMQGVANLMNAIMDKIDDGVMIFDNQGNLCRINAVAREILKLDEKSIDEIEIDLEKRDDQVMGMDEYAANVLGKEFSLAGSYFEIHSDIYNGAFIFKDIDTIKASVRQMVTSYERIGVDRLLGRSIPIKKLKEKIKQVASTTSTVMIVGESGTGKELVARALHEESVRYDKPFVAINCAAIPENLLESELFGYVKGAFTGADPRGKMGKFELAHKGTLFLDEIGDMPLYIQVKLLRVLEEREIVRLGENKPIKIDVRVVAATNKDLEELIRERVFREDLFYRLNVIPLCTIPLRKREGDVRLLSDYFINRYAGIFNKKIKDIEPSFWECLEKYEWPGNVRELQNTMEYVINLLKSKDVLNESILPEKIRENEPVVLDDDYNLEYIEKEYIRKALDKYGHDGPSKKIAADKLGIGIATLYRKMKKYGIDEEMI
jgi:transcriptional regulator with PAS, ATPase and Fis domain